MLVALSSSAAPRADLAELVAGCARRGLSALHLVTGHGHGITAAAPERARRAAALLSDAGIRVAGVEITSWADHAPAQAAEACSALSAPLVFNGADVGEETLAEWRSVLAQAGVILMRGVELNAARENVATAIRAAFAAQTDPVMHVTLRGGGPEAAQHEGRGIGTLMTQLALDGYRGVLALAPSGNAVLPVWRAWLHHGRKWGCGSKTADPSLVQLA